MRRPSHHGSILGRRFVTSQGRIDSKKADLRIKIAPNYRIIFKMIYNGVSYADFGIKTDFGWFCGGFPRVLADISTISAHLSTTTQRLNVLFGRL